MDLLFISTILVVVILLGWLLIGYPLWNVWASKQRGEAALQEAMNEQRIQLAEAQARREAATINKEAAIIEAEAVAEQVSRIGKELTHHDLYLKWQWIRMMEEREGETIYVPTEAGLPILEAGRVAMRLE
jgi:selenocysteine lyase/cysteine desulfurase